jgi:hypothetical protein
MLRNLTYKQKLKWIPVLTGLALFLCYELAIKKTISEYSKNTNYIASSEPFFSFNSGIGDLRARKEKINALYDQYLLDTLQPEKNLLYVSSRFCESHNLSLKEYKTIGLFKTDSIQVLTRTITVEGGFADCLRMLYELERTRQVGKVSASEFKSYPDAKDTTVRLDCTIYVQNLISY